MLKQVSPRGRSKGMVDLSYAGTKLRVFTQPNHEWIFWPGKKWARIFALAQYKVFLQERSD
jgi:hypothetical protein